MKMVFTVLVAMVKPQNSKNESVNVCPLPDFTNSSSPSPVIEVKQINMNLFFFKLNSLFE
jgi:hypothetical protein